MASSLMSYLLVNRGPECILYMTKYMFCIDILKILCFGNAQHPYFTFFVHSVLDLIDFIIKNVNQNGICLSVEGVFTSITNVLLTDILWWILQ